MIQLVTHVVVWGFCACVALGGLFFLAADTVGRLDIARERVPAIGKLLNKKHALITLLVVAILLLIGVGYELLTKEVPEPLEPPKITIRSPPPPKITPSSPPLTARVAPPPLEMFATSVLMEADSSKRLFVVLAVTNTNVHPVDIKLGCNYDFIVVQQPRVATKMDGQVYLYTKVEQLSGSSVRYSMQEPAWGPQSPMAIPVYVPKFDESKALRCSITPGD